MHWRSWTGQVPDPVDFQLDGLGDVMADQLKMGMANPLADIVFAASEVVIQAQHLITLMHQAIHQV